MYIMEYIFGGWLPILNRDVGEGTVISGTGEYYLGDNTSVGSYDSQKSNPY
jgi:hypothetical protein